SRALGLQFGGSIGLTLYLAQALSVPFFVLGFTEALVQSFPQFREHFLLIGLLTTGLLFLINYFGASWAIKSQYIVMTVLAVAIGSLLGGAAMNFSAETFRANWSSGYTSPDIAFWVIFAIYFPAVTGILAGVNMSGDLKDPAKSLVRGTLAALTVGFVVYLAEILLCGGAQVRADLIERPFEMLLEQAPLHFPAAIIGGVLAATLSSAMGSFMGAPRVLQALARDRVFPGLTVFARGTRHRNEPREALWLTLVLSFAVVFIASGEDSLRAFDIVASIVAMFFLCTYGMINLAAFVESFGANPSFRPHFKLYHWTLSGLGTAACVAVMMLIDFRAAAVAGLTIGALYGLISRRVYSSAFGDARRGFFYQMASKTLLRLKEMTPDPKNWRPTFLVLSGNPQTRITLVKYGVWLESGRGIVTVAAILVGRLDELVGQRKAALEDVEKVMQRHDLTVFPEVVVTEDLDEGVSLLVQSHSIGPIKPNTVLMGWPSSLDRVEAFLDHLRNIKSLRKSILSVIDRGLPPEEERNRRIDIWWGGEGNGSLMLILAYLLRRNWEWNRARVRILRQVSEEAGRTPAHEALERLAHAGRINAEIVVAVSEESYAETVRKYSKDASVVFLGFHLPESGQEAAFFDQYVAITADLPTTILVNSSGEADLFA
ncbi:MAG: amino acid permease, partial [Verrucomicrobia bacterium]|nr:amino acid permease [Verrucomicrobiota bacterium]